MTGSRLDGLGEYIWTSWWNGCGRCDGCPNRDTNGYFTPKNIDSGLISGDPDPEVVLVGNNPGDEHPDGTKRDTRVFEEPRWEDRRPTLESEIETHSNVLDWLVGTYPGFPGFFEWMNKWPVHGGGAYYTNAKKCADTEPDIDDHPDDKAAYEQCRTFLGQQLNNLNPEVIVTFGNNAFEHTMEVLGREWSGTSLQESINADYDEGLVFAAHGENPAVIPSYHFSWVQSNYTNVEGIEKSETEWEKEYYQKLAKAVTRACDG